MIKLVLPRDRIFFDYSIEYSIENKVLISKGSYEVIKSTKVGIPVLLIKGTNIGDTESYLMMLNNFPNQIKLIFDNNDLKEEE